MVNSAEELRLNRIFSKSLLGKTYEEASRMIEREGLAYRIEQEDKRHYDGPSEVNVRRLNLILRKGVVIDISVG